MTEGPPVALVEFDHIGVQRPLGEKFDVAELVRLLVEHVDKAGADPLALFFGVGDAGEPGQKQVAGVAMNERNVVVAAEQLDHLLGLAGAQQSGVDEDAGQLVAHRLVQQSRGDRRIDPARQAADDIAVADLVADPVDRLRAEPRHRPIAAAAGDLAGEVAQQLGALRRMRDLGMKQKAVKAPLVVGDRGIGRGVAGGDRAKPGRQRIDLVAVAHPHLRARPLGPQPVEQPAIVEDIDNGAAEFLMLAQGDAAAQFVAHRLHAVADAQHRHAELKYDAGRARCRTLGDRGRAARQDDRARVEIADLVRGDRERMDLAIDPALAQPARDQLGDLAAEIEDQDAVGHQGRPSDEELDGSGRRRSNKATKNPSVPWRAGVRNR